MIDFYEGDYENERNCRENFLKERPDYLNGRDSVKFIVCGNRVLSGLDGKANHEIPYDKCNTCPYDIASSKVFSCPYFRPLALTIVDGEIVMAHDQAPARDLRRILSQKEGLTPASVRNQILLAGLVNIPGLKIAKARNYSFSEID